MDDENDPVKKIIEFFFGKEFNAAAQRGYEEKAPQKAPVRRRPSGKGKGFGPK